MKKKKAFFITIEGLEGSGKSSVIFFIKKFLQEKGLSVRMFREPGSTVIGEQIRDILLDRKNKELSPHTELLLYLAARTQLIEEKLQKAFTRYDVVIADRFFDSTLVYQGYALGLGTLADKAVRMFSMGVTPSLTIVLDLVVQEGLKRIKVKDRIESRSLGYHRRLRQGYLRLAKRYPRRITVVDASGDLPCVYRRVEKVLLKRVTPLRRLMRGARGAAASTHG